MHAHVVGSTSNGSTLHIMLRSASDTVAPNHACPPGSFRQETRRRRAARSADFTIVGRSGSRPTTGGSEKTPQNNGHGADLMLDLHYCTPCTECKSNEREIQDCTENHNRICQPCNTGAGGKGMRTCTQYTLDSLSSTSTSRPDRVDKVSVDILTGKFPQSSVQNTKLEPPQDINVGIQEAGRDERNSWYFLSLCALIGLLVFLSLVMGAYLVSVKVTSWWRYQRPVTVRRRGK